MIKSLYVHIPFCVKKCLYCDFNSFTNTNMQYDYVKALEKELFSIEQKKFETIFVGGGTPTVLSMENLQRLLKRLEKFGAAEFTFECNPGTLNREKLELMKKHGVNRLSIGLQAWQDFHLKTLGRIHSQAEFIDNFNLARQIGFDNINIDLMFGIPNQSLLDWKDTVNQVLSLKPEHLSCYGLIIEEGTPFYEFYDKGIYKPVDEEIEREMYYYAIEAAAMYGMKHYEISNFSLPGHECRHNITYWRNEEYVGAGAGAHSFVDKTRYFNATDVKEYIDSIAMGNESWIEEKTKVSPEDEISEYMFLGLRMLEGIDKLKFEHRFGQQVSDIYKEEIIELKNMGLIIDNDAKIALTSRGVDLSNQVFVKFIK